MNSKTNEKKRKDSSEKTFIYTSRKLKGTFDTRHEAIGYLTKYGEWENETVVPITKNCHVRQPTSTIVGPLHLGNKYYGDRDHIPTNHGVAEISKIDHVKMVDGKETKVIKSFWEINCPLCHKTHQVKGGTEESREKAIDKMLSCCDINWFPPSDWREDCDVCGESHREIHECPSLLRREHTDSPKNKSYKCTKCNWKGQGEELSSIHGLCPECNTTAVKNVALSNS